MRNTVLTGLFLILSIYAYPQQITVVSAIDNRPLFNVAIYNEDRSKSALTDFDGIADISAFEENEILHFQHISHHLLTTTKIKILSNNTTVILQADDNQLNEIVLSVSKFQQKKKDIPQQIVSLTSEDIIIANPQTSADLLESSGKVFVQKSQLGGGSPMIRGFSTNRLLIAVDGVRMNTAIFRSGNLQNVISIDPFLIDRTEIILGPGSVIYGSDAVGGVTNFYTKTPGFSSGEIQLLSLNATTRYASANEEKTGHVDFAFGGRNWSSLTSITYTDFEDLRMGSNGPTEYLRPDFQTTINGEDVMAENENPRIQKFTGYDQINLAQKLRYLSSQDWELKLGVLFSTTSDFPRYDRLIRKQDGEFRSAEWFYGPQTWLSANIQANHSRLKLLYDNMKWSYAYQFFEESRNDRDFGGNDFFQSQEQVDAHELSVDFTKKLKERTNVFYGLQSVLNTVGSKASVKNIDTQTVQPDQSRYPNDSHWISAAAYASIQSKLHPKLTVLSGLRYNFIHIDAMFDDSFIDFPFEEMNINTGALTGNAGLAWNVNQGLSWKLNFSTAFRAPNIDDVGKVFDLAEGFVVVPNPDLKPEKAYNAELGFQLQASKALAFDVAAYYTILDNAFIRRDFELNGEDMIEFQGELSQVQAIQNASEARVYGVEAGAKLRFTPHLTLLSQINVTKGVSKENGEEFPLRHAAPAFGNTHFTFKNKKFLLDVFSEYSGGFSFEELAPTEQEKPYLYAIDDNGDPFSPSWYTLNFISRYNFTSNWSASATLENITDQRYRTYSSGIAAAGRNLILAVNYSF
ncbi:TonB-dependent receptor [Gangjinia marincola]|uniref:TonB-dependent receptor n=1 Tax=Gangjinia marincola TaxID=578463 RepID=A0ABP3XWK6_9FLAO